MNTERWNRETDVVVVGTGFAGLSAAIEAARAGAGVLVLEKNDMPGGLSIMAGGHMIMCNTHIQRKQGVDDRVEWGIEDELKDSDYRAVPEIVRTYVERAAETVLWYEQLGLVWADVMQDTGGRVPRGHRAAPSPNTVGGWPLSSGITEIQVLLNELDRLGVPILLKHRMRKIHRQSPHGPVLGVSVDAEGGSINIKARKGVVLATGGYTTNKQMIEAWDSRLVDDCFYSDGLPYCASMGDSLVAGLEVGAGLSDMSFVSFLPVKWGSHVYQWWEPKSMKTVPSGNVGISMEGDCWQRIVQVKNDGARYVNEMEVARPGNAERPEQPFMAGFLGLPKPRNVWAITDAEGAAAMKWPVDAIRDPQPLVVPCLYPDSVAVADSIQMLAAKTGIPPLSLEATVTQYNGFAEAGVDRDFGKPQPLHRIAHPPFFAAKLNVLIHTQCGGLRVNTKSQVVDRSEQEDAMLARSIDEEKVIPHLYAAGECAASIGWRRTHGKIGTYTTLGRIAGENVAAERHLD